MIIANPSLIYGKKVVLRLDIDVPIEEGVVQDDFRLRAGIPTLQMCLANSPQTTIIGHIGRPEGQFQANLSVEPIYDWLCELGLQDLLESKRLQILENLRFEKGEEDQNIEFAKSLASYGDLFINEAFASHHPSASTTVLPQLLPHAAGLHFAQEVSVLSHICTNPIHPLVVIIGGVKIEDKLPAVLSLSKVADLVLVGGKIATQLKQGGYNIGPKVVAANLNAEGTDITQDTSLRWINMFKSTRMIVWNGPLGQVENPQNQQTEAVAQAIAASGAETIIGGGDTIDAVRKWGLVDKFSFISTGGGAMLKFLTDGTLPTIQALS